MNKLETRGIITNETVEERKLIKNNSRLTQAGRNNENEFSATACDCQAVYNYNWDY